VPLTPLLANSVLGFRWPSLSTGPTHSSFFERAARGDNIMGMG